MVGPKAAKVKSKSKPKVPHHPLELTPQLRQLNTRSRMHREEVQRSKPEAMPPDGYRREGTPSLGEGPYAWGKRFFGYFF